MLYNIKYFIVRYIKCNIKYKEESYDIYNF